ncbi:hypothetical protein [Azospirillum halopraeferens]|uniref:hypothetical protein n=1 Tax=Azospirillum halopraeferens TaxID=34010 RepID=UPI000400B266|nr:hypothetical protein [Azospirillum halopraeferens]
MGEAWRRVWRGGATPRLRAAAAVLALAAGVALVAAFESLVTDRSTAYLGVLQERALATFAAARGLNAALSVLASTNVSIVVAQIGPGQVLDPLDDLVEQFSAVMLAAVAAISIERLALQIVGDLPASLLLGVPLAGVAAVRLWSGSLAGPAGRGLLAVLVLAAAVKVVVPLALLAVEAVSDGYLRDRYAVAQERIALFAASEPAPEALREGGGLLQALPGRDDVDGWVQRIWRDSRGILESIISLIAIFLVETVLLPLGVVWLLLRAVSALLRWVLRPGGGAL